MQSKLMKMQVLSSHKSPVAKPRSAGGRLSGNHLQLAHAGKKNRLQTRSKCLAVEAQVYWLGNLVV
jgi:hypothetical protein